MADRASLMSPNALPVMRPVDLTDAAQLDAPTEVIRTVKDSMRAPAALLPWLALEHRVTTTWDPAATVDARRAAIAAQYGILRHAGTPGGLAAALAQLGVAAGFDEWFEYGGEPYTIRVRAGIGGTVPWTAAFDTRVWRTVVAYKNRRTGVADVALVRTMPAGGPGLAGVMLIEDAITFLVIAPDVLPPSARPVMAAAVLIHETLEWRAAA